MTRGTIQLPTGAVFSSPEPTIPRGGVGSTIARLGAQIRKPPILIGMTMPIRVPLLATRRSHVNLRPGQHGPDSGTECIAENSRTKRSCKIMRRLMTWNTIGKVCTHLPSGSRRSRGQYEIAEVRTRRGVKRVLLLPKAILRSEFRGRPSVPRGARNKARAAEGQKSSPSRRHLSGSALTP
jgi:hypothetical protein